MPSDITALTASELSTAIRTRQLSCVETMRAYLARIDRYNPIYNAIVSRLDDDTCLALARFADEELEHGEYRGWLHGIPHAVKDLADARGLPTSSGSPLFAGAMPAEDELHIARIRNAGAIFIGKTNVPEFGMGSQTYNSVFGVTRNAWDPALTAGGSSGGAAVALAAHMLPVADGSDMMGSLRNPAAFNNVVGFRPSQGRVPATPEDLFYGQLSVNGPMGRNLEDTIRLLDTMAGFDPRAPLTMRDGLPGFDEYTPTPLGSIRIGWMRDFDGYLATEPGVLELCEQALQGLESHGARVEATAPRFDMDRLWRSWLTLRHWSHAGRQAMLEDSFQRQQLKPEMIFEIQGSLALSASAINRASIARAEWYHALHALFDRFDLLALPTAQVFPFSAELHWPDEINGRAMDTYHRWMEVVIGGTLAGVPVLNVPVGFDDRGRPMGMQLIGPMGADQAVLEFGLSYELVTGYLGRRPSLEET
ncbi:MAG: amidase [Gammaproteobacteria bacterium]